jgi:hypothetical protein
VMELRSISSFIKMKLGRGVDREILLQSHSGSKRRTRRARLAKRASL